MEPEHRLVEAAHRRRGWGFACGPLSSPRAALALLAFGVFISLFFSGAVTPARAAAPLRFDVFDVFVGYDAIVPEGSWFPVVCEIENKGPGFSAIFEITSSQQSQTRRMPLELPQGTRKRFVIPMFGAGRYNRSWEARLLDERGRVRAEAQVRQVRRENLWQVPMVGAVSRTMSGRPAFPEVKRDTPQANDIKLDVARLMTDVFPDNPISLEGLETLYLSSAMAMEDKLHVNQVNALLAWLHGGGHLIVAIEQPTHVNGTEWLRRLLPCEVNGMSTTAAHTELLEWLRGSQRVDGRQYNFTDTTAPAQMNPPKRGAIRVNAARADNAPITNPFGKLMPDLTFAAASMEIATVTLRDGQVLIGRPNQPLVITARRGRGQITVLTFSPERDPFLSWNNRAWFWAKLANMPAELLTSSAQYRNANYSVDGVFGAMIDSKQLHKLPVPWLMLLLVGYLVVIGPLDRWWLKKIGRQMLTWITFPAYVVFFSLLIYFIGYKLRAGESEWNELHVVDVIPVGEAADLRGRTFASIYSPANERYPLASELPYAALRGELLGNYGGGQESSRASVTQRGNNYVAEIFVPVWTSQLYVNEWLNRAPAPLSFSIESVGDKYRVVITNRLSHKLTVTRLAVKGMVLDLGVIPANDIKTLTLQKYGKALESFVQENGNMFVAAVSQRGQAFGENRQQITDVPLSSMATCFLSYLAVQQDYSGGFISPPGFDLSALVERGDAVLLAWTGDYAPVKGINKFTPRRSHSDTLWRVSTAVNPAAAQ